MLRFPMAAASCESNKRVKGELININTKDFFVDVFFLRRVFESNEYCSHAKFLKLR